MATLKVTNIVKIENTTGEDIVFTPYRQNFLYTLGNGETIEFRTNSPEQSLFYYKSILPIANVELVDSFEPSGDSYDITWNLSGIVTPSVTSIDANTEITITLEAQTGYNVSDEDVVIEGDVESSVSGCVITLSNAKSDITITANGVEIMYQVISDITNGNAISLHGIGAINGGTAIITPESENYDYPQSITVEPSILVSYDSTTGIATLGPTSSDVTITGICEPAQFVNPINVTVINGNYSTSSETISEGKTVTITITPTTGFGLSSAAVNVLGPAQSQFDSETKTITLVGKSEVGTVEVTCLCELDPSLKKLENNNSYDTIAFNKSLENLNDYLALIAPQAGDETTLVLGDYSGTSLSIASIRNVNNQLEIYVIFGMSGETLVIYNSSTGWAEASSGAFSWTSDGRFIAPLALPMTIGDTTTYLNGTLYFDPSNSDANN